MSEGENHWHTGDRVLVTSEAMGGRRLRAHIVLVSANSKSLMLGLDDGPLRTSKGGLYLNIVPLLQEPDGRYHELEAGDGIEIVAVPS